MTTTRADRARSLVTELMVVFLGVLIALAADSWLQGQRDLTRAQSYLHAIEADMGTAEVQLDVTIESVGAELERVRGVLAQVRSDSPLSDTTLVRGFSVGVVADLPLGTLNALLSTGAVELLKSDELRSVLVAEHSRLNRKIAASDGQLARIGNNMERRIVAEEGLRRELGIAPGGLLRLEATRRSPDIVSSYRIHATALSNHLEILGAVRESVGIVKEAIRSDFEGGD